MPHKRQYRLPDFCSSCSSCVAFLRSFVGIGAAGVSVAAAGTAELFAFVKLVPAAPGNAAGCILLTVLLFAANRFSCKAALI